MSPDDDNDPDALEAEVERLRSRLTALEEAIGERFLGQLEVLEGLIEALLADGHVLLQSAPGLGKTTLVKTLSQGLGLEFQRVQFTPDLMPADILGTRVLEEDEQGRRRFVHQRGPIFTQVLLADEINRATPRTQAALLEAMQERQVTLFEGSVPLDPAFFVVATQNPVEMEGTYPLPEAQLDRFLVELRIEPPDEQGLLSILGATTGGAAGPIDSLLTADDLAAARALVTQLPVSRDVLRFAARLTLATSPDSQFAPESVKACVRFGSSPRGAQALVRLGKARALLAGRLHMSDEDIRAVAVPALRHRLILGYEGEARGIDGGDLVRDALGAV
jgi:MoxR-like ATPase